MSTRGTLAGSVSAPANGVIWAEAARARYPACLLVHLYWRDVKGSVTRTERVADGPISRLPCVCRGSWNRIPRMPALFTIRVNA
jgi:hypothetical protein